MSFPARPPSEVFSLGDISNEDKRGHYQSGATAQIQLSQLSGQITQLTSRPLMRIKTTKEGTPTAQRVEDQREVITELNPALDLQRAIHAQTELAQLCFGDLKLTDAEPDVVTEGEARLVSRPPGSATEDL